MTGHLAAVCQSGKEDWLNKLDAAIGQSKELDAAKQKRIAALSASLNEKNENGLFDRYLKLYEEYYIFNYDSAYTYAKKMQGLAARLNEPSLIAYAKIKLSFIQLSSGMFKEVFDSLATMPLQHFSPKQKAEYYVMMARCYYDLADYDRDKFYSPGYNERAAQYIDSSLVLFAPNSFEYIYYSGLKDIRSGKNDLAWAHFQQLMNRPDLSDHELALTASTISDIYIQRSQTDTAVILLIRAAIADIRSSTKETSAIFNLATLLYKQGNLKNASAYIQKAVDDALFYGASTESAAQRHFTAHRRRETGGSGKGKKEHYYVCGVCNVDVYCADHFGDHYQKADQQTETGATCHHQSAQ